MRIRSVVLSVLLLAGLGFALPACGTTSMRTVLYEPDYRIASQPSEGDLDAIAMGGVRTVLNLRSAGEAEAIGFDEQAAVERTGMTYVNAGFKQPETLTDAVLDQALATLRDAERPIFMHCSTSNRAAVVWAAHRALNDGVPFDAAWEEALAIATMPDKVALFKARLADYVSRR